MMVVRADWWSVLESINPLQWRKSHLKWFFMEPVGVTPLSPQHTAHMNTVQKLLVRNWTWEEATKNKINAEFQFKFKLKKANSYFVNESNWSWQHWAHWIIHQLWFKFLKANFQFRPNVQCSVNTVNYHPNYMESIWKGASVPRTSCACIIRIGFVIP